MGDDVNPGRALTIDEVLKLEVLFEPEWNKLEVTDTEGRLKVALIITKVNVGFSGGLQGDEVSKMDLCEARKHLEESLYHPRQPHVTIALLGRVKGETQNRCHLLPIALRSANGQMGPPRSASVCQEESV
jgi:hypothetical protein